MSPLGQLARRSMAAALLLIVACLPACASAAMGANMIARRGDTAAAPPDARLRDSVAVGKIGGGSETSSMGTSQVSDRELLVAVRGTLEAAQLLARDGEPARFVLDAVLEKLDQPLMGVVITVVCRMKYSLRDTREDKQLIDTSIETPFAAGLGDAFFGPTRLRIANEGAVRTNLEKLLDAVARLKPPVE